MPVESPWYFAYGSNLAQGRLEERVGAVTVGGQATLAGHRLSFHKPGRDGSGKCTISPCGDVESGDCVFGVIYALSREQGVRLDRFEGPGYRRELVDLVHRGRSQAGYTYVAPEESLDPSPAPVRLVSHAGGHGGRCTRIASAVRLLARPGGARAGPGSRPGEAQSRSASLRGLGMNELREPLIYRRFPAVQGCTAIFSGGKPLKM